jgi:hypothetical protein
MYPYKKNPPNWSIDEILNELKIFSTLYKDRPIKKNIHGMMFPHMFAVFFILRKLKPELVIESGVFKGQSTWLIEKSLPDAKIISIDINLKQREYISKKTKYSNVDFKYHDFTNIPKNTLVFFDDHQSHLDRIKECKFFDIKNIIFEDNYPSKTGDFLTMRHAYLNEGFNHPLTNLNIIKTTYLLLSLLFKKKINKNYYISLDEIISRLRDRKPNSTDFKNINKNIETYFEFPPIIKITKDEWDNDTNKDFLITTKPLLDNVTSNIEDFKSELQAYNYITYIKLT